MKKCIICLCDYTGLFGEDWAKAGYNVILVDPQHEVGLNVDGNYLRYGGTINEASDFLFSLCKAGVVELVFGFPPCTDVAVSGAAHWENKYKADRYFQAKAAILAQQCISIGQASGAPWAFENPVSGFSSIFGKPQHKFHPYEFGGYLPEDDQHPLWPEYIKAQDAYPKKTCLWSGGGFELPEKKEVYCEPGFSDQHKKLGGRSLKTKNIRSATPRGFARAIFERYAR